MCCVSSLVNPSDMASPGLELLFALVSPEITQPQDALICFIHWELISRGMLCLGKSEKVAAEATGSERLPDGWADNKELYTLSYRFGSSQFLLRALPVEDTLIVNAMDLKTEKISDLTLKVNSFIDKDNLQQFHSVYKNSETLKQRLESEMISPLLGSKEKSLKPEREREKDAEHDPLRVPSRSPASHQPTWTDPSGHFPYGAADLDPLGGRSGGMIMDPFHAGRTRPRPNPLAGLPPGAVPPGARFDPFGPIGSGRPGPDPDHLPPPGYDDMFM
ncbi:proteasome inhibitor PI31 subunit [Pseudophryne corroboree]|uniref:proteasome inhibitor PI31 subunit n=1 Tax=Pseudophryne corroboree TaxID=495146 RepID=UPI0030820365